MTGNVIAAHKPHHFYTAILDFFHKNAVMTVALIAALLDIKFRKALPAVYLGLVLAVTIMCVVSYFIPWLIASAL